MDEERSGVTFGEIFRTIWSQKWLALIVLLGGHAGAEIRLQFA